MNTLKENLKYLVLVDMDEVNPQSVANKLDEAGINTAVMGIPMVPGIIQFYEIKRPFWKRWTQRTQKTAKQEQLFRDVRDILEVTHENLVLLRELLIRIPAQHNQFSLEIKNMSIGNIVAGTTGQLEAQVFENGVPYTPPVGSTYAPVVTWTASDATVTFTPATADDSGGTVPLSQQIVVNVPAGDTSTSVTITGATTDPNGNPLTGTISIPVTSAPQVFTLQLTHVA